MKIAWGLFKKLHLLYKASKGTGLHDDKTFVAAHDLGYG